MQTDTMDDDPMSIDCHVPIISMSSSSLTSEGGCRSPTSRDGSPLVDPVRKFDGENNRRQLLGNDKIPSQIFPVTGQSNSRLCLSTRSMDSMGAFSIGSSPVKDQAVERVKKRNAMKKIGKVVSRLWKKSIKGSLKSKDKVKSEQALCIQAKKASSSYSSSNRHQVLTALTSLPSTPVSSRELTTPSSVDSTASSVSRKRRRSSGESSAASVERKNAQWNQRFNELVEYASERGGSTCVPQKFPPNPQLGKWVQTQRAQYKLFLEERATGDERAKIEMEKKAREIARKKRKKRKIAIERGISIEEVGDFSDVEGEIDDDGVSVESAPGSVKKGSSKKSVKCSLTKDRVAALSSINFVWEAKVRDPWDMRFSELLDYKSNHRDCLVPQQFPANPQLGKWVQTQRAQYKLLCSWESSAKGDGNPIKYERAPSLTVDRRDKLESIGFVWEVLNQVPWEKRMCELIAYKEQHGDCLVPYGYAPNPNLGWWVNIQRQQFRLHKEGKPTKMTQERIDRLEAVNFIWDAHEVTWREKLKELKEYKNDKGDCLVPCNYPPNPSLGKWVMNQRQMYKKLLETKERLANSANGLDGPLTPSGTPSSSPSRRKSSPGVGIMPQVRIEALESVGFAWTVKKRGKRKRHSDGSMTSGASYATGESPASLLTRDSSIASSLGDEFSPMSPIPRYQQSPLNSGSKYQTPDSKNCFSPPKRARKTSWNGQETNASISVSDIMAESVSTPTPTKRSHLNAQTFSHNKETGGPSGHNRTENCIAII